MKNILLFFVLFFSCLTTFANEDDEIKAVINKMFEGMAKGDSAMVRSVFYPDAMLSTIITRKGKTELVKEDVNKFITAVGTPHKEVWNEKIRSFVINCDSNMASAWTPYLFYVDSTFSHCGVNNFTLIKTAEGWKIISIVDTRYKQGCEEQENK